MTLSDLLRDCRCSDFSLINKISSHSDKNNCRGAGVFSCGNQIENIKMTIYLYYLSLLFISVIYLHYLTPLFNSINKLNYLTIGVIGRC